MDRARKRFTENLARLEAYNPELKVLGDRKWIDECTNQFIVHMSKKIWMHDLSDGEIPGIAKAVDGYLKMRATVEASNPVQGGSRVIKGRITKVKMRCRNHETCGKHWYANVRTEDENTIFTPLPFAIEHPEEMEGKAVEFFAYITPSYRDKTFGFAHQVKLFKEKSDAR